MSRLVCQMLNSPWLDDIWPSGCLMNVISACPSGLMPNSRRSSDFRNSVYPWRVSTALRYPVVWVIHITSSGEMSFLMLMRTLLMLVGEWLFLSGSGLLPPVP